MMWSEKEEDKLFGFLFLSNFSLPSIFDPLQIPSSNSFPLWFSVFPTPQLPQIRSPQGWGTPTFIEAGEE